MGVGLCTSVDMVRCRSRGRAGVTCVVQMGWQKKIWSASTQDLAKLLQLVSFSLTELEMVWFN